MDEQRRMLDELMGKTRNEDGEKNTGRNFWDDDVDKFYLAGFSPFEEFRNTKSANWVADSYKAAFPSRPKLHHLEWEQWSRNDGLKAQYDALSKKEQAEFGYEYDLMLLLEEMIQKCDHRIRTMKEEIKIQNERVATSMSRADEEALDSKTEELTKLKDQVKEAEGQAERGGNFEQLQSLMLQVEARTKERDDILKRIDIWRDENQRAVCEISGNVILPPGTRVQSIHDHEAGKQFQGWKNARQLLKELRSKGLRPGRKHVKRGGEEKEKRKRKDADRECEGEKEKDRDRNKNQRKTRSRSRSKSRSKDRRRDWEKSKDKRSRSRSRSRSKDRKRKKA
mmetsp:Transcript_83852/g.211173  ORF Transcript_83852/g.211173 Transcript_83852/m.211173 type:complete len:338 (-) Transcript_83852:159-1172(-)